MLPYAPHVFTMSYVFSSIQNKHYFWGVFRRTKKARCGRGSLHDRLKVALALLKKKRQITPLLEQGYVHTILDSACTEKKTIPLFGSHIRMEISARVDFENGSSQDRFLPLHLTVWTGFRNAAEVNESVEASIGENWDGSKYSGVTIEIWPSRPTDQARCSMCHVCVNDLFQFCAVAVLTGELFISVRT